MRARVLTALLAAFLGIVGVTAGVAEPAAARSDGTAAAVAARGPVGWSSYRELSLLPLIRRGVTTYQVSSADPTNHDDDGYDGRYSCLHRVALGCLMASHDGPGELESVWTAGNQVGWSAPSGKLIVQLDGRTVIDSTWPELTAGPPTSPFSFPLVLAPDQSFAASSIQVPMPFRRSMRVISQFNPHYFHVVFRTFATGADLPDARAAADGPSTVMSELLTAGTHAPAPARGPDRTVASDFKLASGATTTVAHVTGSGLVSALRLRFSAYGGGRADDPAAVDDVYEHTRLRISFDGVQTVDAPVGEFFGSGLGPAPVRSLMFAMDGTATGWATSWWPMPFDESVTVSLYNGSHTAIRAGSLRLTWARDGAWTRGSDLDDRFGYFHAHGHAGPTRPGKDWVFLRTSGAGSFVGVTMTMKGTDPPVYLEGNERAFVDGAGRPQIQGTGTEDFFDGGWYFWDHLFTLPLSGFTAHQTPADGCPRATCKTAYRLMIADAVPFTRSILYEIQHGDRDRANAIYSSTAYWYQLRESRP